jgi:hypothetical protein
MSFPSACPELEALLGREARVELRPAYSEDRPNAPRAPYSRVLRGKVGAVDWRGALLLTDVMEHTATLDIASSAQYCSTRPLRSLLIPASEILSLRVAEPCEFV